MNVNQGFKVFRIGHHLNLESLNDSNSSKCKYKVLNEINKEIAEPIGTKRNSTNQLLMLNFRLSFFNNKNNNTSRNKTNSQCKYHTSYYTRSSLLSIGLIKGKRHRVVKGLKRELTCTSDCSKDSLINTIHVNAS